ncbi:MAG: hypothetical protein HUU06_01315 [Planctomycetaceae bacterium]|nr:hypothetical protein [Planctomycetota bacterium]NUN51412.1 hypothetical protein [Planctomycetaceae bacterium]
MTPHCVPDRTFRPGDIEALQPLRKYWGILQVARWSGERPSVCVNAQVAPRRWRTVGRGASIEEAVASALGRAEEVSRRKAERLRLVTTPYYCPTCGQDTGRTTRGTPRRCEVCAALRQRTHRGLKRGLDRSRDRTRTFEPGVDLQGIDLRLQDGGERKGER